MQPFDPAEAFPSLKDLIVEPEEDDTDFDDVKAMMSQYTL